MSKKTTWNSCLWVRRSWIWVCVASSIRIRVGGTRTWMCVCLLCRQIWSTCIRVWSWITNWISCSSSIVSSCWHEISTSGHCSVGCCRWWVELGLWVNVDWGPILCSHFASLDHTAQYLNILYNRMWLLSWNIGWLWCWCSRRSCRAEWTQMERSVTFLKEHKI